MGDVTIPDPESLRPKGPDVGPPVQGPLPPGGVVPGPPNPPPPKQVKKTARNLGFIFGRPSGPGRGVPTRVPPSVPSESRRAGRGSFGQPFGLPPPAPLGVGLREPVLPSVDGMRDTGRGFRALAFSGRGWAGVISAFEIGPSALVRRRKVGPVPVRGLVRDFNYAILGVDDTVSVFPVWSYSDAESDLALEDEGGDHSLITATPPGIGTMRGYTVFMSGGRPLANPNYVLPDTGVYLGIHVFNNSVGSVVYEANFEVLEVV